MINIIPALTTTAATLFSPLFYRSKPVMLEIMRETVTFVFIYPSTIMKIKLTRGH